MNRRRWWAILALWVCSGCRIPEAAQAGRPCEAAEPCGEGLVCSERLCVPSRPALPRRAAFYQLDYPEGWTDRDKPSRGRYQSDDLSVIASHLNGLIYARFDAGILRWDGRSTRVSARVPMLLTGTRGKVFRWAIEHAPEGTSNPSADELALDLAFLTATMGTSPHAWRVDGRMVVFVRSQEQDDCELLQRWRAAADRVSPPPYLVVQTFPKYADCTVTPDGWYPRESDEAYVELKNHAAVIQPGRWPVQDAAPSLKRDTQRFADDLRKLQASEAPFQLVRSFNAWSEGTAVGCGTEWETKSGFGRYLDLLSAQ